jgi:hypothetical protein
VAANMMGKDALRERMENDRRFPRLAAMRSDTNFFFKLERNRTFVAKQAVEEEVRISKGTGSGDQISSYLTAHKWVVKEDLLAHRPSTIPEIAPRYRDMNIFIEDKGKKPELLEHNEKNGSRYDMWPEPEEETLLKDQWLVDLMVALQESDRQSTILRNKRAEVAELRLKKAKEEEKEKVEAKKRAFEGLPEGPMAKNKK